jgi:hypothetical protein
MKNSISFAELLDRWLGHQGQFKVDRYQRFYKWGKAQCDKLFNDILEWATNKHTVSDYFVQSVAIFEEIRDTIIQLVDGQQRITSLSLLNIAFRNIIIDNGLDKESRFSMISESVLYSLSVPQSLQEGVREYRIILQDKDNFLFKAAIERNYAVLNGYKNESIVAAYNLFYKSLEKLCKENIDLFFDFYYKGLKKVSTLVEECETQEEANLCFIRKNGTGKIVEKGEVCISMLYYKLNILEYSKSNDSRLDECIKTLLKIQNEYFEGKESNWFFTRFIYYKKNVTDVVRENGLIAEFDKLLSESNNIFDFIDEIRTYYNLEKNAERINPKVAFNLYRELYLVWADLTKQNISLDEARNIMYLLDGMVTKRWIYGYGGNADKSLAGLVKKASAMKGTSSLTESIIKFINLKKRLGENIYYNFPANDELYNVVINKSFYGSGGSEKTRHILELINDYLCDGEDQMLNQYKTLEIEHIMPQSSKSKYVNALGNLTFLDESWNKKASNKAFNIKKEKYGNSVIKLNRYFDNIEEWNEDEIKKRTAFLCERMNNMWSLDYELTEEDVNNFNEAELLEESYNNNASTSLKNEEELELALANIN